MIVDGKYFLENLLIEKLDLMIKRMKGTDDNVVLVDGDEGQGKTNLAAGVCYYISVETGRDYTVKEHIFFDLDKLIEYASKNKEKIIHWDEGALGGLTIHWWKKNQIKFTQLLMIARKKQHFIVICIPKFFRLTEYMVVDRSIALLHVYSRGNMQKGRFCYYNKRKKELLFEDWKRKRKRSYKKYSSFRGSFPIAMEKIFNEVELDEYEDKKDEAIRSLSKDEKKPGEYNKLKILQKKISEVPKRLGITAGKLAESLDLHHSTLTLWKKSPQIEVFA